jgi:hypothetical protein
VCQIKVRSRQPGSEHRGSRSPFLVFFDIQHKAASQVTVQTVALIIVIASGLWLEAVSFLMALRPRYCLQLLDKMASKLSASSWRLNLTEQGLRIVAGAALIVRSSLSKVPLAFEVAGWCLVISSLLILALPMRWHVSYGRWWHRRLTPLMLLVLSPVPAIVGAGIVYGAV